MRLKGWLPALKFTLQGWGQTPLRRKFFAIKAEAESPKPDFYCRLSFRLSWHSLPAVST